MVRHAVRSLVGRLRAHCDQIGIRPPLRALRHYAVLRYLEATWWQRDKLTEDRADLLESYAYRLKLDSLRPGTPLCGPDLPDCVHGEADLSVLADWPDAPLMLSFRDLA